MGCHTTRGGKPYAGGRELVTPFGKFVTPNITPDNETGIGHWSEEDFGRRFIMVRAGMAATCILFSRIQNIRKSHARMLMQFCLSAFTDTCSANQSATQNHISL